MPLRARHPSRGTFQVSAAAPINISRAAAPAWRSGSNPERTLRLPTVNWSPYAGSASACATCTRVQSASSSSATIIGIAVFTPWPISERPVQMVTAPSGVISIQALGLNGAGAPLERRQVEADYEARAGGGAGVQELAAGDGAVGHDAAPELSVW